MVSCVARCHSACHSCPQSDQGPACQHHQFRVIRIGANVTASQDKQTQICNHPDASQVR